MMLFKEDWDACQKRFDAFWRHDIVDRCCVAVTAPRDKPMDSPRELRQARDLAEQWTDSEYRAERFLHRCAHTYYGGEAFPCFWGNLGPGVLAACIGGSYVLGEDTVWFDRTPIISDLEDLPVLRLDEAGEMWGILAALNRRLGEGAKGRYAMGMTDLGGTLDIAASLAGAEELLMGMVDAPKAVAALAEMIDKAWMQAHEKLFAPLKAGQGGMGAWMPLWCADSWYPLQCDLSAMISPEMFARFAMPSLRRQANFLAHSVYHMDGEGEIPHLDHILDIGEIDGIQWTPGPASPCNGDASWVPMYQRIQAKGKNLVLLYGVKPRDIERLLGELSPRGLFLQARCESEQEARDLLKAVEKWSAC